MSDKPSCTICGEPMPDGEEMFKFHGYSGPCPKPRLADLATADYIYDPDDWEVTYNWADRSEALEHADLATGDVKRFATLIQGPDKFAARVVVSRDDDGNIDETEIKWFDTEAEAKAAAGA